MISNIIPDVILYYAISNGLGFFPFITSTSNSLCSNYIYILVGTSLHPLKINYALLGTILMHCFSPFIKLTNYVVTFQNRNYMILQCFLHLHLHMSHFHVKLVNWYEISPGLSTLLLVIINYISMS